MDYCDFKKFIVKEELELWLHTFPFIVNNTDDIHAVLTKLDAIKDKGIFNINIFFSVSNIFFFLQVSILLKNLWMKKLF